MVSLLRRGDERGSCVDALSQRDDVPAAQINVRALYPRAPFSDNKISPATDPTVHLSFPDPSKLPVITSGSGTLQDPRAV